MKALILQHHGFYGISIQLFPPEQEPKVRENLEKLGFKRSYSFDEEFFTTSTCNAKIADVDGQRLGFDTGSADIEIGILDAIFGKPGNIADVTAIPRTA
jgi:hypothetical protein